MALPIATAVRVDMSDMGTAEHNCPTAVVTEPPANACELANPDALTWIRYDDGGLVAAVPTWRILPPGEAS
jgi:hypothetical protein